MGQVISIVSTVIDVVKKFKDWATEDRRDADKKRLDDIRDPIEPPKFYTSIPDRQRNVPAANTYSVDKIRESLNSDIVPAGYSIEQLESIGFRPEVERFRKRRSDRVSEQRNSIKAALWSIIKLLEKGFPDLSEEDRTALQRAGLFNDEETAKLIVKIKGWINEVDKNQVDPTILDEIIAIAQARTSIVTDALDRAQLSADFQSKVREAQGKRDTSILEILNRSLRF